MYELFSPQLIAFGGPDNKGQPIAASAVTLLYSSQCDSERKLVESLFTDSGRPLRKYF